MHFADAMLIFQTAMFLIVFFFLCFFYYLICTKSNTNGHAKNHLYFRIEEAKRAMKRPASDADRYNDVDRKRSSNDRRFEQPRHDPPPPPRFDTAIRSNYDRPPEKKRVDDYASSSSKRNDDYKSSSRAATTSIGGGNSDVSSFKRPIDSYKRSNDIEPPSRSGGSGGYDQRVVSSLGSSTKDNRFNDSVDNRHIR